MRTKGSTKKPNQTRARRGRAPADLEIFACDRLLGEVEATFRRLAALPPEERDPDTCAAARAILREVMAITTRHAKRAGFRLTPQGWVRPDGELAADWERRRAKG